MGQGGCVHRGCVQKQFYKWQKIGPHWGHDFFSCWVFDTRVHIPLPSAGVLGAHLCLSVCFILTLQNPVIIPSMEDFGVKGLVELLL